MLIVGITGGTGVGKTTLLDEFRSVGAYTLDCDALYHDLLSRPGRMLNEIKEEFPGAIKNGKLDRKALGGIVFTDDDALLKLNGITHKYILSSVERKLRGAENGGKTIAAVDAVALIESGLYEKCDAVVGIIANHETRASRVVKREGVTIKYAKKRVEAQQGDEFYRSNCDYVLVNDFDTEEDFRNECRKLIEIIIEKSGKNEHL